MLLPRIFLLAILAAIIFPAPALAQTFSCGAEEVSSGSGGEIRITSQNRGEENSGNCPPSPCSAGTFDVGVFTDKTIHLTQSYPIYRYERICVKGATVGEIKQCQVGVKSSNSTATPCTPDACSQGINIAMLSEIRNYDYLATQDWTTRMLRICAGGGWISEGSSQWAEQQSPQSFPDPSQCPSGEESVGTIKESHHFEPDFFRTYRLCVKYSPPSSTTTTAATTSSTTTTIPPATTTTSNSCAVPHGAGNYAGGLCAVVSCDSGYYNCDGNSANGCEATTACATATTSAPTTTSSTTTTTIETSPTTTTTLPDAEIMSGEDEAKEFIASADERISLASNNSKNTTSLEKAKALLQEAKNSEIKGDYSLARDSALAAIILAEENRKIDFISYTETFYLGSVAVAIIAILAIAVVAIIFITKRKEDMASKTESENKKISKKKEENSDKIESKNKKTPKGKEESGD